MGVSKIFTRGVLPENYQGPIFFQHKILLICHDKTSIQRSQLFEGRFSIHVPNPMCFCLFSSKQWTCQPADMYLRKQKKVSLETFCPVEKKPSLFAEFLNGLNFFNAFNQRFFFLLRLSTVLIFYYSYQVKHLQKCYYQKILQHFCYLSFIRNYITEKLSCRFK